MPQQTLPDSSTPTDLRQADQKDTLSVILIIFLGWAAMAIALYFAPRAHIPPTPWASGTGCRGTDAANLWGCQR